MRLTDFERDAERLLSALGREHYLQAAGLKTELEIGRIYDDHRWLTDPETFHDLRAVALDEPLGEKYRRFLLEMAATHALRYGTLRETEAIATAEASSSITWGEREISYRSVPVAIANEADPDRRHELDERWREVVASINPQRSERHRRALSLVPSLEMGDAVQLWDALHGLELARLTEQMRALLDDTADLYRDSLRDALADQQLAVGNAWRADLSAVLRRKDLDTRFPPERLVATLVATLRGLGFDLEEQTAIRLDLESRPGKSARAFCARLAVPAEVRLVLRPIGGYQDYATLLHEAGHAEHFANIDATLPFGYRWLGDAAITEGYAFLLQYLVADQLWLQRYLDYEGQAMRHLVLFQKLMMLRRYATKLLYEQELLRTEEPEPLAERYADLFSHHLLVRYFPEEYLADVDEGLYAAQYLRAWIFEAQLRAYLRREYDEEWFRAPKAGRFIRDLWREGQRYTADELVRFMGYEALDPAPMLAEVREGLE